MVQPELKVKIGLKISSCVFRTIAGLKNKITTMTLYGSPKYAFRSRSAQIKSESCILNIFLSLADFDPLVMI